MPSRLGISLLVSLIVFLSPVAAQTSVTLTIPLTKEDQEALTTWFPSGVEQSLTAYVMEHILRVRQLVTDKVTQQYLENRQKEYLTATPEERRQLEIATRERRNP